MRSASTDLCGARGSVKDVPGRFVKHVMRLDTKNRERMGHPLQERGQQRTSEETGQATGRKQIPRLRPRNDNGSGGLNDLNAKHAASAAAQDGLFQFRLDRSPQDGRVGLFLPAQSALALVGWGESFFDQ